MIILSRDTRVINTQLWKDLALTYPNEDVSIRVVAYSETDEWVVEGKDVWRLERDGNVVSLFNGYGTTTPMTSFDIANPAFHMNDLVLTVNGDVDTNESNITCYMNGSLVEAKTVIGTIRFRDWKSNLEFY